MARWPLALAFAFCAARPCAASDSPFAGGSGGWPFTTGALAVCLLASWAAGGFGIARSRRAARRAKAELAEARGRDDRYRNLFESAGDAVWETDPAGRVVALNPAGEKLFAVESGRAIGRAVTDFLDPADCARVRASGVKRAPKPFEVGILIAGRELVTVELCARAMTDGRVQAIARDVTERKRLQERAALGQRLESLGRLAGGVAHDFNNLLTVIAGSAEVLNQHVGEAGPVADSVARIRDCAARAARLTRQLLAFGRASPSNCARVDLPALISSSADLFRSLTAGRVALELDLAADTPPVLADPVLVEQILLNLVVNARDASSEGGAVTIRTFASESRAVLEVRDCGIGMDAATRQRAFEPFFTTKPAGEGTGLGLATVYGAVETLGGQIHLHSAPGVGTTFVIELPAAPEEATPPPARPRGDRPTVLLVEDDDDIRELVRIALEQAGFRLLVAEDGLKALELAAGHPGPIDLVLTDMMMPHCTGRELAARLAEARPGVRVLYMSGYTGDELRNPGREEFFLPKPFRMPELVARVGELAG